MKILRRIVSFFSAIWNVISWKKPVKNRAKETVIEVDVPDTECNIRTLTSRGQDGDSCFVDVPLYDDHLECAGPLKRELNTSSIQGCDASPIESVPGQEISIKTERARQLCTEVELEVKPIVPTNCIQDYTLQPLYEERGGTHYAHNDSSFSLQDHGAGAKTEAIIFEADEGLASSLNKNNFSDIGKDQTSFRDLGNNSSLDDVWLEEIDSKCRSTTNLDISSKSQCLHGTLENTIPNPTEECSDSNLSHQLAPDFINHDEFLSSVGAKYKCNYYFKRSLGNITNSEIIEGKPEDDRNKLAKSLSDVILAVTESHLNEGCTDLVQTKRSSIKKITDDDHETADIILKKSDSLMNYLPSNDLPEEPPCTENTYKIQMNAIDCIGCSFEDSTYGKTSVLEPSETNHLPTKNEALISHCSSVQVGPDFVSASVGTNLGRVEKLPDNVAFWHTNSNYSGIETASAKMVNDELLIQDNKITDNQLYNRATQDVGFSDFENKKMAAISLSCENCLTFAILPSITQANDCITKQSFSSEPLRKEATVMSQNQLGNVNENVVEHIQSVYEMLECQRKERFELSYEDPVYSNEKSDEFISQETVPCLKNISFQIESVEKNAGTSLEESQDETFSSALLGIDASDFKGKSPTNQKWDEYQTDSQCGGDALKSKFNSCGGSVLGRKYSSENQPTLELNQYNMKVSDFQQEENAKIREETISLFLSQIIDALPLEDYLLSSKGLELNKHTKLISGIENLTDCEDCPVLISIDEAISMEKCNDLPSLPAEVDNTKLLQGMKFNFPFVRGLTTNYFRDLAYGNVFVPQSKNLWFSNPQLDRDALLPMKKLYSHYPLHELLCLWGTLCPDKIVSFTKNTEFFKQTKTNSLSKTQESVGSPTSEDHHLEHQENCSADGASYDEEPDVHANSCDGDYINYCGTHDYVHCDLHHQLVENASITTIRSKSDTCSNTGSLFYESSLRSILSLQNANSEFMVSSNSCCSVQSLNPYAPAFQPCANSLSSDSIPPIIIDEDPVCALLEDNYCAKEKFMNEVNSALNESMNENIFIEGKHLNKIFEHNNGHVNDEVQVTKCENMLLDEVKHSKSHFEKPTNVSSKSKHIALTLNSTQKTNHRSSLSFDFDEVALTAAQEEHHLMRENQKLLGTKLEFDSNTIIQGVLVEAVNIAETHLANVEYDYPGKIKGHEKTIPINMNYCESISAEAVLNDKICCENEVENIIQSILSCQPPNTRAGYENENRETEKRVQRSSLDHFENPCHPSESETKCAEYNNDHCLLAEIDEVAPETSKKRRRNRKRKKLSNTNFLDEKRQKEDTANTQTEEIPTEDEAETERILDGGLMPQNNYNCISEASQNIELIRHTEKALENNKQEASGAELVSGDNDIIMVEGIEVNDCLNKVSSSKRRRQRRKKLNN